MTSSASIASGFLLLLVLAGCSVSFSPDAQAELPKPTAGTPSQQAEAIDAAREYLALIDDKKFGETWERAGSVLKDRTSEFWWTNALKASRALHGSGDREIEGLGFTSQIETGVPVDDYVLVQFKSASGSTTLTEKIVMQKEQGTWKIIGYFATTHRKFGGEPDGGSPSAP